MPQDLYIIKPREEALQIMKYFYIELQDYFHELYRKISPIVSMNMEQNQYKELGKKIIRRIDEVIKMNVRKNIDLIIIYI